MEEIDLVWKIAGAIWTLVTIGCGFVVKIIYDRYRDVLDDLEKNDEEIDSLKLTVEGLKHEKVDQKEFRGMFSQLEDRVTAQVVSLSDRISKENRMDRQELKEDINQKLDLVLETMKSLTKQDKP